MDPTIESQIAAMQLGNAANAMRVLQQQQQQMSKQGLGPQGQPGMMMGGMQQRQFPPTMSNVPVNPNAQQQYAAAAAMAAGRGTMIGPNPGVNAAAAAAAAKQQQQMHMKGAAALPKNQRLCRNMVNYGHCRNAGRGCEYNHSIPEANRVGNVNPIRPMGAPSVIPQAVAPGATLNMFGGGGSSTRLPGSSPPRGNAQTSGPGVSRAGIDLQGVATQLQFSTEATRLPRGYDPIMSPHRYAASGLTPKRRPHDFSISDSLRQELQMRTALTYALLPEDHPRISEIPSVVNKIYHSLFPLDSPDKGSEGSLRDVTIFGCQTRVFKAINSVDGFPVCLMRADVGRIGGDMTQRAKDTWRELRHPSIVGFKDAFVSADFPECPSALVLVYEYLPGAETLQEKHLGPTGVPVTGEVMWSYVSQVLAAVRFIHGHNLACRSIHPSKILVTADNRIRLNTVGAMDIISNSTTSKTATERQYQDLLAMARLMIEIMCQSTAAWQPANLSKSLETIAAHFHEDLKALILMITTPTHSTPPTVFDISNAFAGRLLCEMETLYSQIDRLERECAQEMENGRMLRLLIKLGFINERPDFDTNRDWSENGDRYLLKLFRDYVFHQVAEDQKPLIDYGSVLQCLNKLDAGSPEKLMLISRDQKNVLIVTYDDVKNCVEGAFQTLVAASQGPPGSSMSHSFQPL